MERCKMACDYMKNGYNCSQSVLLAFRDLTGLGEKESTLVAAGFGSGAGTGEMCGAVSGGIMVLGLLNPADPQDPVSSRKRCAAEVKAFQQRFSGKFGALRCQDLLKRKFVPDDTTPAARDMGLTGHCLIMVVTAVEILEELLAERE